MPKLLLALVPLLFCGVAASGCAAGTGEGETSAEAVVAAPVAPPNFVQVRDGLYRGGHPDAAGLAYLQSIGVKTIVDLEIADFIEATPWSISEEFAAAPNYGLTIFQKPMSWSTPTFWGHGLATVRPRLRRSPKAHPSCV